MKHKTSLKLYPNQVAGHRNTVYIMEGTDQIYKLATETEHIFYIAAQKVPFLLDIIPKFYGPIIWTDEKPQIILQDVVHGYNKPCMIDIKLGKLLYDALHASPEKQQRMELLSSTTTTGTLGFRISGMQHYTKDGICITQSDKLYWRGLNAVDVPQIFHLFFEGFVALNLVIAELERIQEVIQNTCRLIGASLLICHEAVKTSVRWNVKLIDFAHSTVVQDAQEPGVMDGITTLINILKTKCGYPSCMFVIYCTFGPSPPGINMAIFDPLSNI